MRCSANICKNIFHQVQHIATAALVWLYGRYDLGEGYKYIAASLLLFTTYKPLLVQ